MDKESSMGLKKAMSKKFGYKQLAAIIAVVFSLTVSHARAEFILSGSLNWHASSPIAGGAAGVTVLPSVDGGTSPSGLLFYVSRKVIPAQGFHPSKLLSSESESCFLEYSKEKGGYTRLVLPGGDSYVVDGNLTVKLGQLRVSLSVENNTLPFVSAIYQGDETSVLAFLNNQSVANGSGSRMASWFEAGIRNVEEFEVKRGKLQLQGMDFKESKVGLPNQSSMKNPCINKNVIVVAQSQWTEYLRGRVPTEIRRQIQMIKQGQNPDALSKYTVLNILSTGVVALDGYGKPVIIQEERQRAQETDAVVCTVANLPS